MTRRDLLQLCCGAALAPPAALRAGSREDALERWLDARFGMFIHWGPYSVAGVEASWPIMRPNPKRWGPLTEKQYRRLPERFNPVKFDPEAWVELAREAGQRYMIFTTKHHDGFCMFDSSYPCYKITNTPYGKDIVAQLAEACRDAGMPLGFYYSPPDMNHPGFRDTSLPAAVNWHGEPERPEWFLYLDYMEAQLRELLTRYGPVFVIWFDGLGRQEKYDGLRFHRLIRELSPATLINNRIGLPGDFETPEQFLPRRIPTRGVRLAGVNPDQPGNQPSDHVPPLDEFRPWETCMTINRTWAYNPRDRDFKSTRTLVRTLVEVAGRGGNFLLNVGPTPEGTIQPEFQKRLRGIGRWLETNGDAIYGTTYGPVQGVEAVRTTAKPPFVYVHVFDPPAGPLELPWEPENLAAVGLGRNVTSARLLATGAEVPHRLSNRNLRLEPPRPLPDPDVTVIQVRTGA